MRVRFSYSCDDPMARNQPSLLRWKRAGYFVATFTRYCSSVVAPCRCPVRSFATHAPPSIVFFTVSNCTTTGVSCISKLVTRSEQRTKNGQSNCIEGQDMPVPRFSSLAVYSVRVQKLECLSSRGVHAPRHSVVTTARRPFLHFFQALFQRYHRSSRSFKSLCSRTDIAAFPSFQRFRGSENLENMENLENLENSDNLEN